MDDSDPGSGRLTPADSRHRRYCSFAASGPGIRVIELHILGMQIQLLSINMGRHWPPLRTITVERCHCFANRCGRDDLIRQRKLLLLLSEALEYLRAMWP